MDFWGLAAALTSAVSALGASAAATSFARRKTEASVAQIEVTRADLDEALDAAVSDGGAAPEPVRPPTSSGHAEAVAVMTLYMRDLVEEASRIAKRLGADGASRTHVREAASRIGILRSRAGVVADVALAVGSLLIGGAIAYQINLWTGGTPADGTPVYAVLALAVGVGIFVWAATTKWRHR